MRLAVQLAEAAGDVVPGSAVVRIGEHLVGGTFPRQEFPQMDIARTFATTRGRSACIEWVNDHEWCS